MKKIACTTCGKKIEVSEDSIIIHTHKEDSICMCADCLGDLFNTYRPKTCGKCGKLIFDTRRVTHTYITIEQIQRCENAMIDTDVRVDDVQIVLCAECIKGLYENTIDETWNSQEEQDTITFENSKQKGV